MRPATWFIVSLIVLSVICAIPLIIGDFTFDPPSQVGDGPDYEAIGYSIWHNGTISFPWSNDAWRRIYLSDKSQYVHLTRTADEGLTASRPPAFPALIASVYAVMGRGPRGFAAVRFVGSFATAIAGAIGVWIAATITRRCVRSWQPEINIDDTRAVATSARSLRFSVNFASTAALALAILDGTSREYYFDFLTEPYAALVLTSFIAVGIADQSLTSTKSLPAIYKRSIQMGLLFGLLVLIRSMYIVWLPFLIYIFYRFQTAESAIVGSPRLNLKRLERWYASTAFVLTAMIVITPWCIRNITVTDRMMPMGTQGQLTLIGGYCNESLKDLGNWNSLPEIQLRRRLSSEASWKDKTSIEKEVALSDAAGIELKDWISNNLQKLPRLFAYRVYSHWAPFSGASLIWKMAIVFGFVLLIANRNVLGAKWLISMPIISTLCVALLYETGGRFLMPLHPYLYAIAGLAVGSVFHFANRQSPIRTANELNQ